MKSRKFILAMFTVGISSLLLKLGSLTDVVYGGIIGTVVAAYIAGNVSQKAITK